MKITASVDHIEEGYAILMIDEERIQIPQSFLPKGVKQGNWVDIIITENKDKEAQVSENVQNLLEHLKRGDHLK